MRAATCLALVDWGDERNPCKYSTCVVGNEGVDKAMTHASSACQRGAVTGDNLGMPTVIHKPSPFQRLMPLLKGFDGPLAFGIFLLACAGLLTMYSSGFANGARFFDHGRNMLIAGFIMFVVAQIPPQKLMSLAVPLYTLGVLLLLASFGLFLRWRELGVSLEEARTVAVNVFVAGEIAYLFNCRNLRGAFWQCGWFSNPWFWGGIGATVLLQGAFTYWPAMNRVFASAPLSLAAWGEIGAVALGIALAVGLEKRLSHPA